MKLAVPKFLKAKAKPAKAPAPAERTPAPRPSPPIGEREKKAEAPPALNGAGHERYMRRREAIRYLGITAYEFRKWIEAGLLTPHRRPAPDPHRLSGKNRPRGRRALFLLSEVEAVRLENR